jgi:hypothetical protein
MLLQEQRLPNKMVETCEKDGRSANPSPHPPKKEILSEYNPTGITVQEDHRKYDDQFLI